MLMQAYTHCTVADSECAQGDANVYVRYVHYHQTILPWLLPDVMPWTGLDAALYISLHIQYCIPDAFEMKGLRNILLVSRTAKKQMSGFFTKLE